METSRDRPSSHRYSILSPDSIDQSSKPYIEKEIREIIMVSPKLAEKVQDIHDNIEEQSNLEIDEITERMDSIARKVANGDTYEYYKLQRSDSDMSQYSDLVDEMISDQIDPALEIQKSEYEILDAIVPNKEVAIINLEMKELERDNRAIGQKTRNYTLTKEEGEKLKAENHKKIEALYIKRSVLPDEEELDYVEKGLASRRMHFFRGKSMNTRIKDPITGASRVRTKQEKEEYVTKKYIGIPVYSDATYPIRNDNSRLEAAEKKVRKYVKNIKSGEIGKEIFGNDHSYTNAVGYLMSLTELNGCPLVATSKFSSVAGEYNVGQMGGSSGGGRDIAFGYQKNGKPVNRVLGNGFAISIPIADYKALRKNNDLIDATMDAPGELTTVNRKIEEVTFTSKIDGKFVKGSLPMILPRFDRDWDDDMTIEKHRQYKTVFNIDKNDYLKFQKLLETVEYPLGELTEHLIKHYGKLLRNIVINSDRREGYKESFVAISNSSQEKGRKKCGDLYDINNDEISMAGRDARTDSSKKKSLYFTQEKLLPTSDNLEDRLTISNQTPINKDLSDTRSNQYDDSSLEESKQEDLVAKVLFTTPEKESTARSISDEDSPLNTMSNLENTLPSIVPSKTVTKSSERAFLR